MKTKTKKKPKNKYIKSTAKSRPRAAVRKHGLAILEEQYRGSRILELQQKVEREEELFSPNERDEPKTFFQREYKPEVEEDEE